MQKKALEAAFNVVGGIPEEMRQMRNQLAGEEISRHTLVAEVRL